jgi:hypothetical protein
MDEVYLNLMTQVFNRPADYPLLMVGEEQVPSYTLVKAYYRDMFQAISEYEQNRDITDCPESPHIVGLAQKVVDAIKELSRAGGKPKQEMALFEWQLEAEGAIIMYGKPLQTEPSPKLDDEFFKAARIIEL